MITTITWTNKLSLKQRDTLDAVSLVAGRKRLGCSVDILQSIDSTNIYVKNRAREGAPHGFVALAEQQTSGRGRFDREWFSPQGSGLYFSILLRPKMPIYESPRLTLLTALSVCETIRRVTGLDARIKWPNDILIAGKKCCGISLELGTNFNALDYVVLGIGVNVNTPAFPESLNATSLAIECGNKFPRAKIARAILYETDCLLSELMSNGFSSILQRYCERSCTLGERIFVTEGANRMSGIAEGFDDLGFLLLKTNGTILRVSSGDVTLREE